MARSLFVLGQDSSFPSVGARFLSATRLNYSERRQMFNPTDFPLQIVQRVRAPFDGADWLFEIKHDGFRMLAIRDGGSTRLYTRRGFDMRGQEHIERHLDRLPAERFVIDGELVALDEDGRSNFSRLMHGRKGTHYYVFDLLHLDGRDMRTLPLETETRNSPRF